MKKLISTLLLIIAFLSPVSPIFDAQVAQAATDVKNDATLSTSLVSYWELEEVSGTRVDSHGSNDLTDNNTVGQATGLQGNAADFDDTNSEYLSGGDVLDITTDRSYAFATKFETAGTYLQPFVYKWGAGDSHMFDYYNGALRFRTSSDGSSSILKTVSWSPSTATWYCVAVTFDLSAGEVKFYVDGSQQGTTQTGLHTSIYNTSEPFVIGRNSATGGSKFDGILDEYGAWNKVLTSTEISDICNSLSYIPYDAGGGGGSSRRIIHAI